MFKPMLAPNKQLPVEELPFPLLASYKYDGIRAIFKDGNMYTRSLKGFPNKNILEKFQPLMEYSKTHNVILDGEMFDPTITFNELSGTCRAFEAEINDELKFYCFDYVIEEDLTQGFKSRVDNIQSIQSSLVVAVDQWSVFSSDDVSALFQSALDNGFEGLILRDINGRYKCGRGTLKEGLIFKLKPYVTFDAKVIGVVQATKVDPNAEKTINELGRSVTSKKKGDRIPIDKVCDFIVFHEVNCPKCNGGCVKETDDGLFRCPDCNPMGKIKMELKVSIAMTDEEKTEIWKNKESYIGRTIEYKGMMIGAKDLPRHPVFLRFREDKD